MLMYIFFLWKAQESNQSERIFRFVFGAARLPPNVISIHRQKKRSILSNMCVSTYEGIQKYQKSENILLEPKTKEYHEAKNIK